MSSVLFLVSSGLVGDAICTLKPILDMGQQCKEQGNKLYVVHANQEVLNLCPNRESFITLGKLSDIGCVENLENARIEVISASRAWQAGINDLHMVQAHQRYLGLPVTDPRVNLQYDANIDIKYYDFLISPYSRSNHNDNKRWGYARWQEVIDFLTNQGFTIGVLGTSEDPKAFEKVDYIFDRPLAEVCSYIKNVKKGMLTIDAGISHLVHNIGSNHLLLYPQALPLTWVNNTNNCITLRDEPINIQVSSVIDVIKQYFISS